jgi:Fic family protein
MTYRSLQRHNIPAEIIHTDALVASLMRIAETKPFVDEYLGSPQEVQLLRKAKIRAVTYSNQIEGNALGESEVTAVLQGKRVAGLPKDVKEVQNYHSALDYAERLGEDARPLKQSDMCDLQRLVTQGVIAENLCGRIRTIPVSIVNAATGEKLDDCPEPHALNELLNDLWRWLKDTEGTNAFTRAFAFHFICVSIHPFADGNGRTVRLMQHLLLLRDRQHLALLVPSETVIMRNRERYYASIRQSRALGKLHPILEFLAECFAVAAEEVVDDGRRLLRDSAGKTPAVRHQKILAHAKKCDEFSMQDVIKWLPSIPRRTLERDLASLAASGEVTARGERKGRVYKFRR